MLTDGDDAAWVELWEVFEEASAAEVRRILAEHGVTPEDADAVVTKCWSELTQSEKTLRPMLGKSRRELKRWLVDGVVLCALKLVEAGKVLLGEPTNKKPKRIKSRTLQFETLEDRQMLAVDLLSFQLANDTGTPGDNVTSNPIVSAVVSGDFSAGHVDVEFDNYSDDTVEHTMTVYTPGEEIAYDPRPFDASVNSHNGPFALGFRTIEYDSSSNVVSTSAWQDFNFTLEQLPDVDIQVYDEWYTTIDDGVGSVDFGSTSVGATVSQTFEIANNGSDDLTLDSASLTLPSGFQLVSGFDATVSQYSSTYLTIELSAASEGYYTGTLAFATNDPDSPIFDFTVSGQVTNDPPEIDVQDESYYDVYDSGSFDFGTAALGTPVTQTFTIYNYGYGQLQLDRASLALPGGFEIVSEFAETVAPYDSTTLTIRMLADQVGSPSGTLSFATNDADEDPFNFTISGGVSDGSGGDQEIEVFDESYYAIADDSGSLDIGSTTVGSPLQYMLTIENWGYYNTLTLDANSLVLPEGFSVVSPFDSTVSPGYYTYLTVQLDAASAGSYEGTLSFDTNDVDEDPFSFFISGEVSSVNPVLEVRDGAGVLLVDNSATVHLGDTVLGDPLIHSFVITNTGLGDLTLDTTTLQVPDGFTVLTSFSQTLASGNETELRVRLDAEAAGLYQGDLSFSTNGADDGTFNISLSGNVSQPDDSGVPLPELVIDDLAGGLAIPENAGAAYFTVRRLGNLDSTSTVDSVSSNGRTLSTFLRQRRHRHDHYYQRGARRR